ncbi:SH3 domain-containing protein [Chitiniphilus eburneus]|uniref:SH3 domain-containing protein n=1 Tax=Chitiniphilus eburneus TaxID=2571148 RepID=A0A4U0PUI0_9NEIS|nr:SH3 domain-containing protein [Chitiniphilus eburneus]TJZ72075.1 SH3 domain-containing protein [Chitiniphilus eburneus]
MKRLPIAAALAALLLAGAALAESGTVIRATPLKQQPFLDAGTVAQLPASSVIDIVARKGAWMQVKTRDNRTGWVKLLNVRTGGASGGGGLGTVGRVLSTGSSGTTVTTGVKGLSAEQIENAKPNYAELDKMNQYRASTQSAAANARSAGLKAESVNNIAYPRGNSGGQTNDPQSQRRGG